MADNLDEMLSLSCRQGKQDIVELILLESSGAKVNYRNKAGNTHLLEACSQGHISIALLPDRKANIDAPTETTSDSALTWACTLGNEEVIQFLLEHRACIAKDGCTALMLAALAGHEKVARLLLEHGAKLNVESDSNKDSPLTFACWKGHQKVVELFLTHNANIEHRTKEGFTPLLLAAQEGHTEVVRLLLENRAEVNNPGGSNNDIPLTSACWKGHHAVVELLLLYNSNIEYHTKDNCTPLILAAREGHLSVAQLLLNHSAKVNVPSGSNNNIALSFACWKGHTDIVELLLHYNSNIDHQNKAGDTPLMLAAREGHFKATELLLLHQAQPNMPSGSNDDTPLTLASWQGHEDVVNLLLDKQSNVNHQTKTGCTPLMEATREGHVGVAKMLLESGADVETPDNNGLTPFFMACWNGDTEVASLLLDYGANKNCRTKTGITAFFQACQENHVEVVKLLLESGCNPSSIFPKSKEYPLTLAAEKGFLELTQVLISRNVNVECRTKKGCTPFFLACKEGFSEIAITLVKHGADTEAADQCSVTPLLAAFRNGHVDVVEWLLGHVAHLPSDLDCEKALMAPKLTEKDVFPNRSKCLELIMKAKKAREQAALKNAQILFEELDAEKEKKESKRKTAARKRTKQKEKKKKEQAEKNTENEREEDGKDYDEDDDKEEESTIGPHPQPKPPQTVENREIQEPPTAVPTRERSKRNRKKPVSTETVLATPTLNSSATTAATRTSLQAPAHLMAKSCGEESGDEMFVDAPLEFLPDNVSLYFQGSGNECEGSKAGGGASGSKSSRKSKASDGEKGTKKSVKSAVGKSHKGKHSNASSNSKEESKGKRNSTKGKNTPEVATEIVPPKSPGEKKRKTCGNKSPDSYTVDKRVTNNERRESPVPGRDDEEECWDNELEPSSDWSNEQQQPFISKQVTRSKSWSAVATVAAATTAAPIATTTPSASSKNWQEVSGAIKMHQLTVSNSLVGRIIGRKGMKINQIQADSGAQISISRAIPRSIDRLVTIKGTKRSVNTARELIEEALSTSSRNNEDCQPLQPTTTSSITSTTCSSQTSSSHSSTITTSVTSSLPPTTNAWHTPSNVWGQPHFTTTKRYSDVVSPPSSSLDSSSITNTSSIASRRTSLPVNIASTSVINLTASPTTDSNPVSNPPPPSSSETKSTREEIVTAPTGYLFSHNGYVPMATTLGSLEEADEIEVLKHKRSHSEPTTTPLSSNQGNSTSSLQDATPISLLQLNNHYSPTMPSIFSPSDSESKKLFGTFSDPVLYLTDSSVPPVSETPPTTSIAKSLLIVGVTRTSRMVGVVTPTQSVKPYQHEGMSSQSVSPTVSVAVTTTTTSNETSGRGNFGAIGPPNI